MQLAFPTEARFASDPAFANAAYSCLITRLLARGTTTALLYATMHAQPCRLLADLLAAAGMRAFVGKVGRQREGVDLRSSGGGCAAA